MSHSFQIIDEIENPQGDPKKSIRMAASTTLYIPLTDTSHWDSVYGIWFHTRIHTVGLGNVTLTLQGTANKEGTGWADIGTGVVVNGGTPAAPIQNDFLRSPVAVAAGTQINALQPFLRMKCVTDAGTVAAIHMLTRTIRGLV